MVITPPVILRIDGVDVAAKCSRIIGIARRPEHGDDADHLLRAAETAIYLTKANGKDAFFLAKRRSHSGIDVAD